VESRLKQSELAFFGRSLSERLIMRGILSRLIGALVIAVSINSICLAKTDAPLRKSEVCLLLTDTSGQVSCVNTLKVGIWDWCKAAVATREGGFALACKTDSCSVHSPRGIWLIVTDGEGTPLWDRCYAPGLGCRDYDIQTMMQLRDGRFVLAGSCWDQPRSWLFCVAEAGEELWSQVYDIDECRAAVLGNDGGYILVGFTKRSSPPYKDGCILKTDSSGQQQWMHTYGGELPDVFFDVTTTTDGRIVAVGDHRHDAEAGPSGHDAWVIITDSKGNVLQDRTYRRGHYFAFHIVQLAPEGGFLLRGLLDDERLYMKIGDSGDSLWSCHFDPSKGEKIDSCLVEDLAIPMAQYLNQVVRTAQPHPSCPLFVETGLRGIFDWLRSNGHEGVPWSGGAGILPDGYFWAGSVEQPRSQDGTASPKRP
jgi:hypothetical protein